jgi:hypothetical protein
LLQDTGVPGVGDSWLLRDGGALAHAGVREQGRAGSTLPNRCCSQWELRDVGDFTHILKVAVDAAGRTTTAWCWSMFHRRRSWVSKRRMDVWGQTQRRCTVASEASVFVTSRGHGPEVGVLQVRIARQQGQGTQLLIHLVRAATGVLENGTETHFVRRG